MMSDITCKPEEALRKRHGTICELLDSSEETLDAFRINLFERDIIDNKEKNSVGRNEGQTGADALMNHVEIMVQQQPNCFNTVLDEMEGQPILAPVARELRDMTGGGTGPRKSKQGFAPSDDKTTSVASSTVRQRIHQGDAGNLNVNLSRNPSLSGKLKNFCASISDISEHVPKLPFICISILIIIVFICLALIIWVFPYNTMKRTGQY